MSEETSAANGKCALCCIVNPCYRCEACGFVECKDHWNKSDEAGKRHFKSYDHVGITSTGVCSLTGITTYSNATKPCNNWTTTPPIVPELNIAT